MSKQRQPFHMPWMDAGIVCSPSHTCIPRFPGDAQFSDASTQQAQRCHKIGDAMGQSGGVFVRAQGRRFDGKYLKSPKAG
jgi:hypothetical protein